MKKEDVYIIGFPKSGNTWLSRLVSQILDSKIEVNSIEDRLNNSENGNRDDSSQFVIHKIHYIDNIKRLDKGRKIYIVRDPRDVFISGFYHNHRKYNNISPKAGVVIKHLFNYELKLLTRNWSGSIKDRISARFMDIARIIFLKKRLPLVGNWSEHFLFWSNFKNISIIRYEDLLDNPEACLCQILEEQNLPYDIETVRKAIDSQSFDKKRESFQKQGDSLNANFMRKGKKEGWKDDLTPEQVDYIEHHHHDVMLRLSYISNK